MPIAIEKSVPEKGTIFFDISFYDEDGAPVIPTAITWTLTDERGAIINSRSAVSVALASSITIALSGLDNQLIATWGDTGRHLLTIEAAYTSTHGAGMTLKEEIAFRVKSLIAVA
jgi:hypothetical protein